MPTRDDHRRSAVDRVLPVRARGDLQDVEVSYGGQASFVVKDPVADESFHLSAVEHRLLKALRRPTSLRGLQRIVETEFAPRRATVLQLQQFVSQLHEQGLLVGENPGQGVELLERGLKRRRRSRWASLLQVLSIRVGGFNAGPLVDKLYGAVRWICSPWAMAAAAIVLAYAALVVLGNAPIIAARLPALGELVQPRRLPLWIGAVTVVKVLHELGHALVCRHFGARPQEMGILLLAGAPALYCDVSDAWRLPSKWRRMAVSSAGMAVELMIAAVAAILWWHAAPGMVSAVCLSLIVVCSVHTLAVNANPLLRYDGYYLLADWLEVPNLAERARGLVAGMWRRWLLGEPAQDDAFVGPSKRRALWTYAVLSKIYLTLVMVGIFLLMVKLAKPHGLQNAVYTLAVISLVGMLLQPVMVMTKMAANPGVRGRLRWLRVGATLALLGGLAGAAWWWPMTRRVEAPLVAVPADARPVFAVTGGELIFATPEGTQVAAGDVLARLDNPSLEFALVEIQGTVRERRVRLEQLRTLQAVQPAAARMLPTAVAELADAEAQLAEQQAMVEGLVIHASVAGRVLAAPPRPMQRGADGTLPMWNGSPLAQRNRGAWIDPGTPLAVIATPDHWVAWAAIDQTDVPAVAAGQSARMLVDEHPTTVLTGRVVQVSRRARDNRRTADAATRRDAEIVGDDRYHVVEIAMDATPPESPAHSLLAGARGTAKIATYDSTLGELAWLHVRRLFMRAF
jgi:putative peptide zinc metalloprotease protein